MTNLNDGDSRVARHTSPFGRLVILGVLDMSSLVATVRTSTVGSFLQFNPLTARCLEFLQAIRSVNPQGRWKILVVDDYSQKLLGSVLKQFDILEENVTRTQHSHLDGCSRDLLMHCMQSSNRSPITENPSNSKQFISSCPRRKMWRESSRISLTINNSTLVPTCSLSRVRPHGAWVTLYMNGTCLRSLRTFVSTSHFIPRGALPSGPAGTVFEFLG